MSTVGSSTTVVDQSYHHNKVKNFIPTAGVCALSTKFIYLVTSEYLQKCIVRF